MATPRIENSPASSGQLSLFSEMTIAELGDNSTEESIDDRNDDTPHWGTRSSNTGAATGRGWSSN
jgi:hypothetical protein